MSTAYRRRGAYDGPRGWTADGAVVDHEFERISVLNGKSGEQRKPAPADLAPDAEHTHAGVITQRWNLSDYRDPGLLLVCRYAGTQATLSFELPDELTTCEQTFRLDAKSHMVVQKDPAPSMLCR